MQRYFSPNSVLYEGTCDLGLRNNMESMHFLLDISLTENHKHKQSTIWYRLSFDKSPSPWSPNALGEFHIGQNDEDQEKMVIGECYAEIQP